MTELCITYHPLHIQHMSVEEGLFNAGTIWLAGVGRLRFAFAARLLSTKVPSSVPIATRPHCLIGALCRSRRPKEYPQSTGIPYGDVTKCWSCQENITEHSVTSYAGLRSSVSQTVCETSSSAMAFLTLLNVEVLITVETGVRFYVAVLMHHPNPLSVLYLANSGRLIVLLTAAKRLFWANCYAIRDIFDY